MVATLVNINTSLFISLCILSDLTQQKIPRELCSEGDPTIFLCSHVPMERSRRKGTDQENSIRQEGKNGGKKEKRSLHTWRFPYSCVLRWLGMPWGYHPCGDAIHMGTFLTTSQDWKKNTAPPVLLRSPCIQVIIQAIVSSVRSNYCKQ